VYATSAEYKAAIAATARLTKITGAITLLDDSVIEIDDSNVVSGSLYLASQCVSGDDIDVGSVYVSELGLSLITDMENPYTLDGARIAVSFGIEISEGVFEYVPLGYFYVVEITRKQTVVGLKAYDGLIRFDVDLDGVVTSGTPYEIVSSICNKAGMNLATIYDEFAAFANSDVSVSLPEGSSVKTCRDLLMWVCQMTSTFARVNGEGHLELRMHGAEPVRTISADERFVTEISDNEVLITKVAMEMGGTTYAQGTDGMTMLLDANPLFAGMDETQIGNALDSILQRISTVQYTPGQFEMIGDPSLESGDMLLLTGPLIADTKMLMTKSVWHYRGKHTVEAVGKNALLKSTYSQTAKAIATVARMAEAAQVIAAAANQSTQLLNDAIGGNVIIRKKDGVTNEILIMDSADPETATRIWRWNINGLGYSDNCTGADNPDRAYTVAMTMDGAINANFIRTGKLQAIEVEGITGTFTSLKAGDPARQHLHMGVTTQGEPFINMFNKDGDPMLSIDMDEISFPNGIKIAEFSIGDTIGAGFF
jgi:Ni,Fe-hydrogenase III small subunit